ncbi:MAG TPA: hypothetical protein P5205_14215 [Candidatus Paceibacterota bacterium]|nr:hypothetical protein [Verrucomicrobiota bacterium]HSA11517.1 hypothetical protein [Candidatus Paceibacterota bacterium]
MPTSRHLFPIPTLTLALLFCVAYLTAGAAQTASVKPGAASAATKAAPADPEPPKSIFRVPNTPQEGRDPFFPQSVLHKPVVVKPTKNVPAPAPVELELKGITGPEEKRLAIINNRTFEIGEEGFVLTNVGRVRITCKQIGTDSVCVALNGQDRTLTFRPR